MKCYFMVIEFYVIACAWIAYGTLHSVFAADAFKRRIEQSWPSLWPAYRLIYNLVAVGLLQPVIWITHRFEGVPLWHVPAWIAWPALVITVASFLWSLKWYDGATFLGLRQWQKKIGPDGERESFKLSPFHRYVRHPWYAMALLLLWTRDLNAAWLVAALVITFYFITGSRLEENKLAANYGSAYRRYCRRVPGLFPLPGRSLSVDEARMLETQAHQDFETMR